jgi:hypothetical protein
MTKRVLILIFCLGVSAHFVLPMPHSAAIRSSDTPASLLGAWVWIKDSDGQAPVMGAAVTLLFGPQGTLDLFAFRPGEEIKDHGCWSVQRAALEGGTISLELPEIGVKVDEKPYRLKGDILRLPFTLINQVPGTSEWRRQAGQPVNQDDFIAVAYDVYQKALEAGADDDAAAEAAAAALQSGEFALDLRSTDSLGSFAALKPDSRMRYSGLLYAAEPAPAPSPKPKKARLAQVKLSPQKSGLIVRKERGGRIYYIWLKFKMPKSGEFRERSAGNPLTPGFFVKDPRTHLYMQPGVGRSDPARHTAVLLFPMNSQKNFRRGQYFVFKNNGEDPAVLRKQLLRAGTSEADITVKVDAEVTPKVIADSLVANPGLFYISTHGLEIIFEDGSSGYMLISGTKAVPKPGQTLEEALVQAVSALGLPGHLAETLSPGTLSTGRLEYEVFLACGNPFFDALRQHGGWDMSGSLVYLDACESTANSGGQAGTAPYPVRIFQAKAFLGWRTTNDIRVAARYSQHFFRQAVRKTHSAREIWDHMWRVVTTRQSMYEEDKDLDSEDIRIREKLAAEIKNFEAFGSDQKPYQRLTDVVHWLVWLGRWNQDPEKASGNLESCYKDAWSKKKKGLGISPLCTAGYLGRHAPTAAEVNEARHLLNGLPQGAPGGRWTLADKIPYLHPVGTPYDKK